jgi:hypothetical protein
MGHWESVGPKKDPPALSEESAGVECVVRAGRQDRDGIGYREGLTL